MAVVRAVVILPAWPPPKVELHLFLAALGETLGGHAGEPTTASQHLNEVHAAFTVDRPVDDHTRTSAEAAVLAAMAQIYDGPMTVKVVVVPDDRPGPVDLRHQGSRRSQRRGRG